MASDEQVRMELEALFAKIDVREQLRRHVGEQVEAYKPEDVAHLRAPRIALEEAARLDPVKGDIAEYRFPGVRKVEVGLIGEKSTIGHVVPYTPEQEKEAEERAKLMMSNYPELRKYEGMFVPIRFREILPPKEQGDRAESRAQQQSAGREGKT